MEKPTVYTIGHSNYSIEEFLETLKTWGVQLVIDVRSVPRSEFSPQFNREALRSALRRAGIGYRFAGRELGGRGVVDAEVRRKQLKAIADQARHLRIAVMCAEEDPGKCHRSRLADELCTNGLARVQHIRRDRVTEHAVQLSLALERE